MSDAIYRINPDGLVHDSIGGEAIVLSIKSGTYYNLAGTAADVWALLGVGGRLSDMSALLTKHYGDEPALAGDVKVFVETLERDGLVVTSDETDKPLPDRIEAASDSWKAPELTAYEDLQDLLTIDPIHDVDDSGWPNARPG